MKASTLGLGLAVGGTALLLLSHAAPGAVPETAGLIVIECEHFDTNRPASGHAWQAITSQPGFVGQSAMQATPNTGANISSSIQSSSPALTYRARFTNSGAYNFWVRAWGANGSDDSVYVGVDGAAPQSISYSATGIWVWQSKRVTIGSPGVHSLNVWMREDGAYVDRILLAANLSYTPTGTGPPETVLNQPPIVQITSPPSGQSFRVGTTLALSADASDPNGSVVQLDFLSDGALQARFTSPPYFLAWTPPLGAHFVQAIATDNEGARTTNAITVTIVTPSGPTFRYAASANRIYVENGGTATLTAIKQALPNAPLQLVDPVTKTWLLRANLFVTDGATLLLHGDAAGGDVNELRLLSINTEATNRFVSVEADWGVIDLNSTHVTSWNEPVNGPNTDEFALPRAYIRARSRRVGPVFQQSALNVLNSEVSYLGYNDPDGYALTWQVVTAPGSVGVTGNVSGSYIHDCQFGVATWSVDAVIWTGNEVAKNTLYGFDTFDPGHQATLASNNVHDNNYRASFRWSGASQRIYITGPGDATLSQVKAALPEAPLQLVDAANKVWYVGANLFVESGARLLLYGPAAGGDVAELRLKSDNNASSNAFVEVRADWGHLDIRHTRITSWDSAVNGPDTETALYRRAYVRARSTLNPDGVTAHESRMDIIHSDIGYLGSHNTEAYGVTWKVVDTTAVYLPPGTTNTLFDVVNVYGDILNSRLHHNYFGMYSYGHHGGWWANNEVDHNLGYGFDPHDDSDYLVIENNNVHDNGWHGIIASKRCDHGIMRNNISWHNGRDPFGLRGNGLMLHRSCNDWVVEGNRSYDNWDSGIALFETSRTRVYDNLCLFNGNAGIRMSVGSADNVVTNNDFGFCGGNGIYLYEGNDPPEADDTDPVHAGRPRRNFFGNNLIYVPGTEAVKINHGDDNTFKYNSFELFESTNLMRWRFEGATNNLMISNSLPAMVVLRMADDTNTGAGTITLVEGQPDVVLLLDPHSTATFRDGRGAVFDIGQTGKVASVIYAYASFASLTISNAGDASTVTTRNLLVAPNTGVVRVTPTSWNLSGSQTKSWTAQASNGTASVTYTVGDLAAGRSYTAAAGSPPVPFGSFVADSQGRIRFSVSDSAQQPLSAMNFFTITYQAVHNGPVLSTMPNRTINELTFLSVINTASYSDVPPVPLAYTLTAVNLRDNSVIPNAAINPNGIITWSPTEAQGPSTNRFTTVVTDGSLRCTNTFTVIVNEVNTAPVLPAQADRTIDELTVLFIANSATDSDLPVVPLRYTLTAINLADNSIIPNAVISSEGVISWAPTEAQGPSTNRFTTVVIDGNQNVANSFNITVNEVNTASVLPVQTDRSVDELTALVITNAATDSDIPLAPLYYALTVIRLGDNSLVHNAAISANGLISWIPTEAQGPSTNLFTTVVSDGNQSATNTLTVIVREVNMAPVLPAQSDRTLVGLHALNVNNTAVDEDIPAVPLTYSLRVTRLSDNSAVANAFISDNGLISWTPTEDQLWSTNQFITIVNDSNASATNSFTVRVRQANTAPILPVMTEQIVYELTPLTVTNTAMIFNPEAALSYFLVDPPTGMTIDASGIIRWTPDSTQSPGTYLTTTVATATDLLDLDRPHLSATNSFEVLVEQMYLHIRLDSSDKAVLSWPARSLGWTLQQADALNGMIWSESTNSIRTLGSQNQVTISAQDQSRFFRLVHPGL